MSLNSRLLFAFFLLGTSHLQAAESESLLEKKQSRYSCIAKTVTRTLLVAGIGVALLHAGKPVANYYDTQSREIVLDSSMRTEIKPMGYRHHDNDPYGYEIVIGTEEMNGCMVNSKVYCTKSPNNSTTCFYRLNQHSAEPTIEETCWVLKGNYLNDFLTYLRKATLGLSEQEKHAELAEISAMLNYEDTGNN